MLEANRAAISGGSASGIPLDAARGFVCGDGPRRGEGYARRRGRGEQVPRFGPKTVEGSSTLILRNSIPREGRREAAESDGVLDERRPATEEEEARAGLWTRRARAPVGTRLRATAASTSAPAPGPAPAPHGQDRMRMTAAEHRGSSQAAAPPRRVHEKAGQDARARRAVARVQRGTPPA